MTLSAKSSLILRENKAAFRREGHTSLDGEERGGDEFLVVSGNKVVILLV